MAVFVILRIFLQQKGSSESKDFDKNKKIDTEPSTYEATCPGLLKTEAGHFVFTGILTIALLIPFSSIFVTHFYRSSKKKMNSLHYSINN
jgi:hypothetical protein